MSTIITFGYLGSPQGKPNAQPVSYILLDDGEQWTSSDPNFGTNLRVADRNGNWAQGPMFSSVVPNVGQPCVVTLNQRYWPVNVGSGFFRESLPYVCDGSIRVSMAEAAVLMLAGATVEKMRSVG